VAILSSLVSDKVLKDRLVAVAIHFLPGSRIINKVSVNVWSCLNMKAIFHSPKLYSLVFVKKEYSTSQFSVTDCNGHSLKNE
jgi:hypothetical protein